MTIPFKSIQQLPKPFSFEVEVDGEHFQFEGELERSSSHFVTLKGKLSGPLELACDSCGEEYRQDLDETVELILTDRVISTGNENGTVTDEMKYDVMEFTDGLIDIDSIAISEINAIKYDYHKCKTCNKEGE